MVTWEHTQIMHARPIFPQEEVDELGAEGWEMFAVQFSTTWYQYFFRRPAFRPDPPKADRLD